MSSAFSGLDTFQALLNTVVRILPLGVYFFTYFSLTIYKDLKVGILLLGLIFNELIGYAFKKYSGKIFNDACSIFGAVEGQGNLAFMNNEHIEIIAFVGSFFLFDMLQKDKMEWFRFNFLIFLLIITIWSRMSIGCINGLKKSYSTCLWDLFSVVSFTTSFRTNIANTRRASLKEKPAISATAITNAKPSKTAP